MYNYRTLSIMKRIIINGFILIFLFSSCNLIKRGTAKGDLYEDYSETELVGPRITFDDIDDQMDVEEFDFESGELAVDEGLNAALRNLERINKQERYYSGFTVLVYSGVDRDQAFKTRNEIYSEFPEISPNLEYQEPRYLLKVGNYTNRIEAQENYFKLKDKFPSARIIQDRFQRNGAEKPEVIQDGER